MRNLTINTRAADLMCFYKSEHFVYYFHKSNSADHCSFLAEMSRNGLDFFPLEKNMYIKKTNKKKENLTNCYNFNIFSNEGKYYLEYQKKFRKKIKYKMAVSNDLLNWTYVDNDRNFKNVRDNFRNHELFRSNCIYHALDRQSYKGRSVSFTYLDSRLC